MQFANEFATGLDWLHGHVLASHQLCSWHLRQHLRVLVELGLAEGRFCLSGEATQQLPLAEPRDGLLGIGDLYLAGRAPHDLAGPQLEGFAGLAVHHEVPLRLHDLDDLVDRFIALLDLGIDQRGVLLLHGPDLLVHLRLQGVQLGAGIPCLRDECVQALQQEATLSFIGGAQYTHLLFIVVGTSYYYSTK